MITRTMTKQVDFTIVVDESHPLGRAVEAFIAADAEWTHRYLDAALCLALSMANTRPDGSSENWIKVSAELVNEGE